MAIVSLAGIPWEGGVRDARADASLKIVDNIG